MKEKMSSKKRKCISWDKARLRYITGEGRPSYADIAKEFGVSERQVERRAKKESWIQERKKHVGQVSETCREKMVVERAEADAKFLEDLRRLRDIHTQQLVPKSIKRDPKTGKVTGFEFNDKIKSYESLGRMWLEICKYIDFKEQKEPLDVVNPDKDQVARFLFKLNRLDPAMVEEFRAIFKLDVRA